MALHAPHTDHASMGFAVPASSPRVLWRWPALSVAARRELLLVLAVVVLVALGRQHLSGLLFKVTRWRGWAQEWSDELLAVFSALGVCLGYLGRRWQEVSQLLKAQTALATASRTDAMRFQTLFATAPLGLAVTDLARNLLLANAALQHFLGYTLAELRGPSFPVVTFPDDVATDMTYYRDLVTGQRDSYTLEKRYIRKDAQVVWGRLTVLLVRDAWGQPQSTLGLVEDCTTTKLAEEALRGAQQEATALHTQLATLEPVLQQYQTGLSAQEWRVLALLARPELSYERIGAILHISGETVKTHVRRMGEKFGTGRRRADVLAAAHERGLFPFLAASGSGTADGQPCPGTTVSPIILPVERDK